MTILLATDLSPNADRAFDRALLMARDLAEPLVALHVVDDRLPLREMEERLHTARQTIDAHLAAAPAARDVAVEVRTVPGDPATAILDQAAACQARVLVLGAHGRASVAEFFLGTTAEQVLRAGRLPLLVVCKRPTGSYARGVIGVDFSDHSRAAVETGLRLFPACCFWLVHAYQVPFAGFQISEQADRETRLEHEAELRRLVDEEQRALPGALTASLADDPLIVRRGSAHAVLREEARQVEADLIVVGTHGRSGVAGALLGSVAKAVLADPICDVLVVQAR